MTPSLAVSHRWVWKPASEFHAELLTLPAFCIPTVAYGSPAGQHRLVPWGSDLRGEPEHNRDLRDAGPLIYHQKKRVCRRPAANSHPMQDFKGTGYLGATFRNSAKLIHSIHLSSNGPSGITCLLDTIFPTAEIGYVQGAIFSIIL